MSVESPTFIDKVKDIDRTQATIFFLDNLIWPILFLPIIVFSILIPRVFFSSANLTFLIYSSAALGAIVLAESICLLSGHFDLSVGSIAGFSAMFTALFMTSWFPGTPGVLGIVIILTVGGFIGLLNGLFIAKAGVNPFLQTLAFLIIFQGGVVLLSTNSITALPDSYVYLGGGTIANIPVAAWLIILLYIVFAICLKYTRSGFAVFAVGGDKNSAVEAGINADRIVIMVYVVSGVLSALGGLLFTGYLNAATPSLAQNTVFPAFAAAVIGGISLFGGRGNVIGALGGVLLLGSIQTGLTMLGVSSQLVGVVNGVILLIAIVLYTIIENYRSRLLASD